MPIKIKSSGGGSVSLDVPNVGTDFTLTMPANNATIITSAGGTITGNVAFTSNNISIGGQTISPYTGMKNRIINGDMRIDQRNAGASLTPTTSGSFAVDRFMLFNTQSSKLSIQQNAGSVTPPSGFKNYFGATSLSSYSIAAGDIFGIAHAIEGYNISDLDWGTSNAKSITLSFWVRSSLTGQFGGFLKNGGAYTGEGSNNRFYPFVYNISSANTWEYKTITIPGDTTGTWGTGNSAGIAIAFNLGAGSSSIGGSSAWSSTGYLQQSGCVNVVATNGATFYITGVQFEVGTTATPFEFRHYGQELALCQRYYFQLTASGSSQGMLAQGYLYATTQWEGIVTFPVDMRTLPVATFTAASTFQLRPSGTVPSVIGYYSATGPSTRHMLIYTGHSAFGSAGLGQSLAQVTPGLTGIYFSAEL